MKKRSKKGIRKKYATRVLREESPYQGSKLKVIPRWGILKLLFPEGSPCHAVGRCGVERREFPRNANEKAVVLYLNLELPPFSLKKTFKRLKSKTVVSIEVAHLHIANGRGNWSGIESLDAMVDEIIEKGIELIVIDPLYKVEDIDENDQAAVKKVLRVFDDITNKTGAALLYVHHFTKGKSKDKNTIDLLAGSGVFARDYDSFLSLTESKKGKFEAKFILRNHQPKADIPLKEEYPLKVVDESAIGGNGGKLEVPTKAGRRKYSTADLVSLFEEGDELNSKELQDRAEGALDVKRSTFHELLQKAKKEDLLTLNKVGNRKFYYLPPASSE